MLKELPAVVSPIINKVYEADSDGGGMAMADMPGDRLRESCGEKADACTFIPVQTLWET